jgi:predicted RNase H-related nuclease YkuK (DUF458 family)
MGGFLFKIKVMEELKWNRMTKGPITKPLVEYLEDIFEKSIKDGLILRVAIGTDSQRGKKGFKFATVIIITTFEDLGGVVVGRGGMVIGAKFYNDKYKKGKEGVKERMIFEVSKSIEVAYEISPLLDLYDIPLEIHADINPDVKWESNKALNEAVGYILGMGYDFKVKPNAFASSSAADRLTKK